MVSDVVVVPVALLTLGFAGLYAGWKRRRVHALMAEIDLTPVREISAPGVVEVEGAARPDGDPLSAPITGRKAVAAAWSVEEWDERGDTSRWREVARGIEATGFEIDDGTAAVAVAPVSKRETAGKWTQTAGVSASEGVRVDDVLAEFDSFPIETELSPDEEPPAGIRRLHDDHDLYGDTGSVTNAIDVGKKHGRRRYAEQVVAPGEEAYVLGRVAAREDPDREYIRPEDAIVAAPEDGLFVLSNQDETSLESEFEGSARALLAAGGAAILLGSLAGVLLVWPL